MKQGLLREVGGSSVVAFDNSGAVFAVACSQTQTIALYAHATMDHVRHPLSHV
jgi:COMPASS component SWD2